MQIQITQSVDKKWHTSKSTETWAYYEKKREVVSKLSRERRGLIRNVCKKSATTAARETTPLGMYLIYRPSHFSCDKSRVISHTHRFRPNSTRGCQLHNYV